MNSTGRYVSIERMMKAGRRRLRNERSTVSSGVRVWLSGGDEVGAEDEDEVDDVVADMMKVLMVGDDEL